MKFDKKECLCPYCGEKLSIKDCSHCSHKDFIFEDVCFCPHHEAYFMHDEPLFSRTAADNISDALIFPEWQGPKKRFYQ